MQLNEQHAAITQFSFLKEITEQEWHRINFVHFPKNKILLVAGDEPSSVLLVLEGKIRVTKISDTGRELTLYRVTPGETCVLMLSSILAFKEYPATAIVESDVHALAVPISLFQQWMNHLNSVQSFSYGIIQQRLLDVMVLVEEIVFRNMDTRIAEYLLRRVNENELVIHGTHDQLATDLGTAREVVSRVLKEFEKEEMIKLSRGTITLLNKEKLTHKYLDPS
ncbi:Crp/Fnr family transcriptional regulator [Sulfoacidibacillus thermotolerans]|uniref:HTH crp-type domain-containing protein n=1 Tax=Sulfoacidibacillus thermotolerans TaxID=1765684 RepID=A0A2U3D8I8_SULT2|nr:Crp/Fnr family transcriptional regulator [Sulfoacidibacillus thermotolerans]PWI57585.1 hypothetical protein BM613_08175 [Sulfoacidibacillus thermotolerans]